MTGAAEMILTPEQAHAIKRRDRFDTDKNNPAKRDRRALLRDRDAIAERIEVMESGIRAGIETAERIYKEHNMPARVAARREYAESIADQLRALVTAIRGEK